jgi:glyoxylase-like metal-dependent hydrolase (beta-lactamase superfamily II)
MHRFVRWLGVAALASCSAAFAAGDALVLAPHVTWLPGEFVPGRQPDSNSVLFEAPEGTLVFDTGRSPRHAEQLLDALKASDRPLAFIVNSHWHLDHIGGNAPLKKAYPQAKVMASSAIVQAREGFLANYKRQIEERLSTLPADAAERVGLEHEIEIIEAREASSPDITVTGTQRRRLAGHEFIVGLAPQAATAGDVWLFDPASKVLASGDLVTLPAPLFDTACPASWQKALDRLHEVGFGTLVPGHGAPMKREGFETYREAYGTLLQCAASNRSKAACIDGWLHDAASLIPAQDEKLARGLLDYYLDQVLRKPEAQQRLGCPPA